MLTIPNPFTVIDAVFTKSAWCKRIGHIQQGIDQRLDIMAGCICTLILVIGNQARRKGARYRILVDHRIIILLIRGIIVTKEPGIMRGAE